jgi:hypothetical protein
MWLADAVEEGAHEPGGEFIVEWLVSHDQPVVDGCEELVHEGGDVDVGSDLGAIDGAL